MRVFNAIGLAALVFAIDQLSKYGVLELLEMRRGDFMQVAPFLNFVLTENYGVNFGLFASDAAWQPYLLAGFAGVVSAFLLLWAANSDDWKIAYGAGAVVGGALANAYDRLTGGAVIDFLNVDCCGIGNPFAFNLADVGVFAGAALILWSAWAEPVPRSPNG